MTCGNCQKELTKPEIETPAFKVNENILCVECAKLVSIKTAASKFGFRLGA